LLRLLRDHGGDEGQEHQAALKGCATTALKGCATTGVDSHDQNRNRSPSCMERIGRTDRIWPKVGEFTTVSIAA
jgi:hypothetical protein